ncbi:Wzz/FepE/Etk N-terminal domain-containing protein [Vibrio diazotrophicus]|uniref:Wzz/FepE/Etk N-terminal domain-containing protein n=1 Tax=Vibrio diazotrophicus TaxID=685 RepID=UPI000C9E1114|nr:Wzz/FepE/Etk N-terminal domain-containing protein [Vibrio diazotrophicus]PNH80314.1 LPS O-antigen length regulator [Vibrio diazotrophicus]
MNIQNQDTLPAFISSYAVADDSIDIRELFFALWRGKWVIVVSTILFSVCAVLFAINQPNIYKSNVLLTAAESSSSSNISRMASQFGGLASLAGLNLGGGNLTQADLAIEVLKSRRFVDYFVKKHDLIIPLMASGGWDLANNKLLINSDIFNQESNAWVRKTSGLRGVIPSSQEVYDVFIKNILSVSNRKDTGLYTVSVSFYSPYMSQQWATWLVEDINQVMRDRSIAETRQNLDYLNKQLQKTSVADMQSSFFELIEEQTKILMLAEVQNEFVFKVVDPAIVPELKDRPKRAMICILGSLLGCMLGVAIVLIRFAFSKRRN